MNLLLIYFLTCLTFCAKVNLQDFDFVLKNIQKYVKNNTNGIDEHHDHALTFLTKRTIKSCPFGLLPSPTNASHCKIMLCQTNLDCATHFGPNTMCRELYNTDEKFCQCDRTHKLDTENRCTVEVGNPLDHSCFVTAQCENWVTNSACIKGRCKCDLGYEASASGAACEKVFCNASAQAQQQGRAVCRKHFGENVDCTDFNECSCDPYFSYDAVTRTGCRPTVSPLGGACTSHRNCSSICLNGQCGCKLGSIEDPASYSRYLCKKVRCTEDSQCLGHWPHTACYVGSNGGCDCDGSAGYVRSKGGNQSCVLRSRLLGTACQTDGDCGRGAHCLRLHSVCTCPAGWGPRKNQMDCQAISCQSDGECQQFGDANLVCQSSGGCVCRKSYQVNLTLAQCTTAGVNGGDRSHHLQFTAITFSLIVLFLAAALG